MLIRKLEFSRMMATFQEFTAILWPLRTMGLLWMMAAIAAREEGMCKGVEF